MGKTIVSNKREGKPKLLHLSEDVIRAFSIKAATEGTSAKILMQNLLIAAAAKLGTNVIDNDLK